MKRYFRFAIIGGLIAVAVPARALSLLAIEDADAVTGGGLDGNNFGVRPWIMENWVGATDVQGHVKWDLTSLSPGSVASATLTIYHDFNNANGTDFDIHRVTGAWTEAALTWNTKPTFDAAVSATLSVNDSSAGLLRSVNVTSLVQGWVNGSFTNDGLVMISSTGVPFPYFRTRDHSSGIGPTLEITVVPEPATMTALALGTVALIRRRRRA